MRLLAGFAIAITLAGSASAFQAAPATPDWSALEKLFGSHGSIQGGVYKGSFPRRDLHVTVGDTPIQPGLALGSWAAFRLLGNTTVVDGDLVVTSDELSPVISAIGENHMEVTAVHNHLAGEQPQIMYVHFFGKGATSELGNAVQQVLSKTSTPIGPAPAAAVATFPADLQKTIETALKSSGRANGAVLGFTFPRQHDISMHGSSLAPAMGMATAINFQQTPRGIATTGDFVLRETEVNPVITVLRQGNIAVTAVHNHLLDDSPRMVFVHFWANGDASAIASTLRKALDSAQ